MTNLFAYDLFTYDIHKRLVDCSQDGNFQEPAKVLAIGADPRHNASRALSLAALNGHAQCVKLLIPLSEPQSNNSEALRKAASNGHAERTLLLAPCPTPRPRTPLRSALPHIMVNPRL